MSIAGRFPLSTRIFWPLLVANALLPAKPNRCSAQLYSVKPPRTVWDSWLFRNGEDYHLFYLQGPRDDRHIGRAVSKDLLHWKRLPWIDSVDQGNGWDRKITHTGWTVKIGNRYACLYGSSGTGQQLNGVMFSDDLLHWKKHPDNPVLVSKPPHYGGKDWRDPTAYYAPKDGLWHGYICAQTATRGPGKPSVPCIGHFTSKDLIHWGYLPPVYENADFADLEVPDYFTQGDWHYFLFSSARTRRDTPTRRKATGTFYVMSEHRDGPYRLPRDPLILGSGSGRLDNYVGRALPDGDGHLLYHHTVGGVVVWGTVKRIEQNDNGTLRLEYWPGLDGLETNVLFDSAAKPDFGRKALGGHWSAENGSLVAQTTDAEIGVFELPVTTSDLMVTCRIQGTKKSRAGLICRFDGQQGIAAIIDRAKQTVEVAEIRRQGERLTSKTLDTRHEAPLADGGDHLRLFVRDHRVEVYLNNEWMFGMTIPDAFDGCGVGTYIAYEEARFHELRVVKIEPLVPTDP